MHLDLNTCKAMKRTADKRKYYPSYSQNEPSVLKSIVNNNITVVLHTSLVLYFCCKNQKISSSEGSNINTFHEIYNRLIHKKVDK